MNNVGRHLRVLSPPGCLSFCILLCIIATELIFYMRLLSPTVMFFSFGEGTFLTMLGLYWLQVTQFKLSKKRKSLVFWACHRGHLRDPGPEKQLGCPRGTQEPNAVKCPPGSQWGATHAHPVPLTLCGNWLSSCFHSLSVGSMVAPLPTLCILGLRLPKKGWLLSVQSEISQNRHWVFSLLPEDKLWFRAGSF